MSCGRISLDETKVVGDGLAPRDAWYAECQMHDFRGRGRDRRGDALNDLLDHQLQHTPRSSLRPLQRTS